MGNWRIKMIIGNKYIFVYWDKKARILEFYIFGKVYNFYIKEN